MAESAKIKSDVNLAMENKSGILFVSFAIFGMVVVWFTKGYFVSSLPVWFLPIPPVAVMLLYATIVNKTTTFALPPEQIGDNCYYLGFIYTLTSLIVALIVHISEPSEIIGDFGIAIISTLAGVLLRVFFNQYGSDPENVERVASQQLNVASKRLAQTLTTINKDFSKYTDKNREMIVQTMNALTSHMQEASRINNEAMKSYLQPIAELASASQSTSVQLERMQASSAKLDNQISGLGEKMASFKMPTDKFKDIMTPALEEINHTLAALNQTNSQLVSTIQSNTEVQGELLTQYLKRVIDELKRGEIKSSNAISIWFAVLVVFLMIVQCGFLGWFAYKASFFQTQNHAETSIDAELVQQSFKLNKTPNKQPSNLTHTRDELGPEPVLSEGALQNGENNELLPPDQLDPTKPLLDDEKDEGVTRNGS